MTDDLEYGSIWRHTRSGCVYMLLRRMTAGGVLLLGLDLHPSWMHIGDVDLMGFLANWTREP